MFKKYNDYDECRDWFIVVLVGIIIMLQVRLSSVKDNVTVLVEGELIQNEINNKMIERFKIYDKLIQKGEK